MKEILSLWKVKPQEYLTYLLRFSAKNSLVETLKRLNYASAVSAETYVTSKTFTIYSINVELTENGFKNADLVVKQIFAYIKKIKESPVNCSYFNEMKKMKQSMFNFTEETNKIGDYLSNLAQKMFHYDTANILQGAFLYDVCDKSVISAFLSQFTLKNSLILIESSENMSKELKHKLFSKPQTGTEPFYTIKYMKSKLNPQFAKEIGKFTNSAFELRKPNRFITKEVALLDLNPSKKMKNQFDSDLTPELKFKSKKYQIWSKVDKTFRMPEYSLKSIIHVPINLRKSTRDLYFSMFCIIIQHKLTDLLEEPVKAGNSIEIKGDELYFLN